MEHAHPIEASGMARRRLTAGRLRSIANLGDGVVQAQLREVFSAFAGFGSRDAEASAGMEGRAFSKMCR